MSLYNMMCGVNPVAGKLLRLIDLNPQDIPRVRDVYASRDLRTVYVYTRTGGNNRQSYEEQNKVLQKHTLYLSDKDDEFDSTFATFSFKVPEEKAIEMFADIHKQLENDEQKINQVLDIITETPQEKFNKMMESLREMGGEV